MGDTGIKVIPADRKLWIGNLDPRITEYQLLKLIQTYGAIEKFDLIFHRVGPLAGLPRGYAFVTYVKCDDACRAKNGLNGRVMGQKKLNVTWAHSANLDSNVYEKTKPSITIPALALAKEPKKADKMTQIQAIEAKLKLMEHKEDELKINDSIATKVPVIQQFQFNKDKISKPQPTYRSHIRHKKPYTKRK
ncbi:probable RNA-binding protein 18 [Euwallacea fornicatus]|uniref:probable RNA-binding protein 18 n=1 Tax=Euwallacea fornicatus TaxID=995702 RepID=UPI00338FE131